MRILAVSMGAIFLSACATTPEEAQFPISNLEASKNIGDGTAIAFQMSAPGCTSSTFQFTQKLADGKYGETFNFRFDKVLVGVPSNKVTKKAFILNDPERLHARLIPAGTYVATRPTCGKSDRIHVTRKEVLASAFEFNVEPAKTNYIGAIKVIASRRGLRMTVSDQSSNIQEKYNKRYTNQNIGPIKMSIALEKTNIISKVEDE